jgi:hypothetical protein
MIKYLQVAIMMCKATGTSPSFLLHPLDVLGGDQVPELSFFPGMNVNAQKKRDIFIRVIRMISRHFSILNMSQFAEYECGRSVSKMKGKKDE